MSPTVTWIVAVVAGLALLPLLLWGIQVFRRWRRHAALRRLAGLDERFAFDDGAVRGRIADADIALTTADSSFDPSWSVTVVPDRPWSTATVGTAQVGRRSTALTGDRRLDRIAWIQGDLAEVLPPLGPRARRAVRRAVHTGWSYDGRAWSYTSLQFNGNQTVLQHFLATAVELARLEPVAATVENLAVRIREEDDVDVGQELVRVLLTLAETLPGELAEELLERRDRVSLTFCRGLVSGRDEALFELVEHGVSSDVRWEAIQALRGRVDDPRIGAALATFVQDKSLGSAAIARLADVGTVAQVPALREVTDAWFDGRAAAAEKAIRAIQARARGSVGQLSVAEDVKGRGAVSVAQPKDRIPE